MTLFKLEDIGKVVASSHDFGAITVETGQVVKPVRLKSLLKQFKEVDFQEDVVIPYWTNNHWSTYDMLVYLLSRTGPAEVGFITWGVGKQAVELIKQAIDAGMITDCWAVFDKNLQRRKSNIHAQALMILPRVGYADAHGKAFVIRNEDYTITAITTSNMTRNRRLEFGVIFTQPEVCEQYFSMIKSFCDE